MLWLRVLSALVGIPLWIFIIYKGSYLLAFAVLMLIIIGSWELGVMLQGVGMKKLLGPIFIGEIILVWGAWTKFPYGLTLAIGISILFLLILIITRYPKIKIMDIAANLFIFIYVGWSLTHIILLRNTPNGVLILGYLFIVIWSTDTGAYFTGRALGKNKLAPLISPNKTIEGAVGGLIFSMLAALIFNWFFHVLPVPLLIVSTLLISTLGQIGDLVESCFKRYVGVKDSGNIIPGHGGILDRFDSTILTAPALFYLLLFFN